MKRFLFLSVGLVMALAALVVPAVSRAGTFVTNSIAASACQNLVDSRGPLVWFEWSATMEASLLSQAAPGGPGPDNDEVFGTYFGVNPATPNGGHGGLVCSAFRTSPSVSLAAFQSYDISFYTVGATVYARLTAVTDGLVWKAPY
jgi:hypothetical protein